MVSKETKQEYVAVKLLRESKTNPRGNSFEGPAFDDLVKSIEERGILVPLIVRPLPALGSKGVIYEVVAGHRRLRAAIKAKTENVPVRVMTLNDAEAREVQIIENLQREDVHPLEEGEAYRKLIEFSKMTVADISVKVGKPEAYVKQRLFLTNLIAGAAKQYREGKFSGEAAGMIARLSEGNQEKVLANIRASGEWTRRAENVKSWIKAHITSQISFQPWLNDKDAAKAVGPCKTCPPNKGSLFGDIKDGQCTDLADWTRKMALYVAYRIAKEPKLVKVTKEYGKAPAGLLGRSNYETLSTKAKDHCAAARQAIVAAGEDMGTTLWICSDPACKKHGGEHTSYQQTPEERKKRKAEIARERTKALNKYNAFVVDIKKTIKWPLTELTLDALIEDALRDHRMSSMEQIAKRLGLQVHKEKNSQWGGISSSYKHSLHEHLAKAKPEEKLQIYVELAVQQFHWSEFGKKPGKGVK